jgi:hypothetical protein
MRAYPLLYLGKWEGAGPWNSCVFWAYRLDAISQGPKNSRIPVPNPLPLPLIMDMQAFKTLGTGLYCV